MTSRGKENKEYERQVKKGKKFAQQNAFRQKGCTIKNK